MLPEVESEGGAFLVVVAEPPSPTIELRIPLLLIPFDADVVYPCLSIEYPPWSSEVGRHGSRK